MGLDWTALEQGLHRAAAQKAAQIIHDHAGQHFYGLALHGVPTQEDGVLVLPVLALNSEEALARDLADEDGGPSVADEDDAVGEEEGGDWVEPPLDGSDPPERDDDTEDPQADGETAEADGDAADGEEPDVDVDTDDTTGGFYSRRWDPTDWHWNAVDLVEEAAASVWERAFSTEVERNGWEATALRYYELMVRVTRRLRDELGAEQGGAMVCFVADDDHAERLLRACLTEQQLGAHFPELVEPGGGLVDA